MTQDGRLLDLVAPGEVGWALCSADVDVYEECTNFAGDGAPIQQFGGTSESAPFIAGGAALVVAGLPQDPQRPHAIAGSRQAAPARAAPTTSASRAEQGAGEMDTLAAVQAARSVPTSQGTPSPTGNGLLIGPTQVNLTGEAGTRPNVPDVTVTNVGAITQIVHATRARSRAT